MYFFIILCKQARKQGVQTFYRSIFQAVLIIIPHNDMGWSGSRWEKVATVCHDQLGCLSPPNEFDLFSMAVAALMTVFSPVILCLKNTMHLTPPYGGVH